MDYSGTNYHEPEVHAVKVCYFYLIWQKLSSRCLLMYRALYLPYFIFKVQLYNHTNINTF